LIQLFRGIFFKVLGNVNASYLKIPEKRQEPNKKPSRATCGPVFETPGVHSAHF